jgi:CubicO group peptidase (beta-lactamase class C family)
MRVITPVLATCLALAWAGVASAQPVFSNDGPDAAAYGAGAGYPRTLRGVRPAQRDMIGTFSGFDSIYPHRAITRPPVPSLLRRAPGGFDVQYRFRDATRSIPAYLDAHPVTGLLIARDDMILLEQYRYGRRDTDRFLSQSMAKTLTGLLVGIAVSEGAIRSIDEPAAAYVPGLAGLAYGQTSIRDLLHMASGVAFTETYDGTDDAARLSRALFPATSRGAEAALSQFNTREAPAGTRFHYAGAETEVLGLVVSHATGMPLSRYLESRIWQPMGAEADASWTVDGTGREVAYCCFNAVLRDWARIGLMLAHDGAWNGRQIVPRQWVMDATTVAAPFLAPGTATRFNGYGYQLWLLPGPRRQFALLGIHGQAVYVDPATRVVMVHTAARLKPAGDPGIAETVALWRAVVARLAGS